MSEELLTAVEAGDLATVRRLLVAGGDVHDDGWGFPLIDEAIRRRDAAMVALLVEFGADLSAVDERGGTRLHQAACGAHDPEAVAFLLQVGLDPNAVDADGWTPLRCATVYGYDRVASILLRCGARAL